MESFLFQSKNELLEKAHANQEVSYVVFSSYDRIQELAVDNPSNVILCSTAGEFTPEGFKDGVYTGFTFQKTDDVEVVELLYPPVKSLHKLKSAYAKVKSNPNAFTLLLCDGLTAMEDAIVTTFFFTDPNYKIIGGSAGDNLAFKETLLYIGKKKVFSIALFFNSKKRTQIIKENLYVSTHKNMLVTDADPIKRTVKMFNNRPAATEYANLVGVREDELANYFMSNPLGRSIDEDIFITSPMKINTDKSITFYSQIIPNTFVEILELADYNQVIADTKQKVTISPSFSLSINCILRSLYFIDSHKWDTVNKELLSICRNQTGFISYGEQYYRNHFNQTMVLLLME